MKKLFAAIFWFVLVSLSLGQDTVKVKGGTFLMGSLTGKPEEQPVHPVTVGSFSIDKFEITYEKWTEVRTWGLEHGYTDIHKGRNGYHPLDPYNQFNKFNPVTEITWYDALKWCNARAEKEGKTPIYYKNKNLATVYRTGSFKPIADTVLWAANGYRLPTEAEWEFAARGGRRSKNYIYSGSNTLGDVAWYSANSDTLTHPVGQKAPNELGIYDMTGNVWELCWDADGKYSSQAQTDPKGPRSKTLLHMCRGGSSASIAYCTSTFRSEQVADASDNFHGLRCITALKIEIIKPALYEVVPANSLYYIKWKTIGMDSIKIGYSNDNGKTFQIITPCVSAAADSVGWQVPDILSSKCIIIMSGVKNPVDTAVNINFRIKGFVLTRFKANGDYEKFDPALHAWQFRNSDENMWPFSWYYQFNYFSTDPYTKAQYPSMFRNAPIRARSSNFIDWPLFVRTFMPNNCYKNISGAIYSPTAVKLWADFKRVTFRGSCFGFSQSCLLAFDRPDQFLQVYPEVGNFANIHDLQLNDSLRRVINQLYANQIGHQHVLFYNGKFSSTKVGQTIVELKAYFLSDTVDHRSLAITSTNSGAHSIVPYRLEKYPNYEGQYLLWVYDNNAPSGVYENGQATAVVLDSAHHGWSYAPLNWTRHDGLGIILEDPASTYLSRPLLWDPSPTPSPSPAASLGNIAGAAAYLSIYNSISSEIAITNTAGQSIGFHDSTSYNTLGDGMPIILQNSVYQPPIGYLVPEGTYSVRMSVFADSLADFSVLSRTGMFNYWRSDALSGQTDRLSYDGGLGFGNPDAQTKTVNLEAITRLTGSERDFQILNCAAVQNDSMRLTTPDTNGVVLVNLGPAKAYDLKVVLAGESSSGQFTHERITMPAHSTHFIVPDWQDLPHKSVKIYQDVGNTGIINDSILVANQATGIKDYSNTVVPEEYSLDQNYPNPFNPATTIRYGLPYKSHVTLAVFNTVGQQVAVLLNGVQEAGLHEVRFDASGLTSGVYFYRIQAGKFLRTCKMLLIK